VKRILHIDMDAFYASVEQRDNPSLRGKPVAVGGDPTTRGVVAAASYEARKFGVRSAIPMSRAVRLCPSLVIIRPDMQKYKAVSTEVFAIYREVTPLVEPLSLDEAYLDVTENSWNEPLGVNVARRLKERIKERRSSPHPPASRPISFWRRSHRDGRSPTASPSSRPSASRNFCRDFPSMRCGASGRRLLNACARTASRSSPIFGRNHSRSSRLSSAASRRG
jgi:DNA polymerase IV